MSEIVNISCPVSAERVNEKVVRVTAAFVATLTGIGLYYALPYMFLLLAVDFALRAFGFSSYSLLKQVAGLLVKSLQLKPSFADAAPKKFAASLGLLFCGLLFVLALSGLQLLFFVVGGLLIVCALLESVFNICLGCYVYTFINTFFKRKV